METVRSTFSSISSKKEKRFCWERAKFIYVPKVPKPRPSDVSKINKTLGTVNGNIHNRTSSGLPKVPIVASCLRELLIWMPLHPLQKLDFSLSVPS